MDTMVESFLPVDGNCRRSGSEICFCFGVKSDMDPPSNAEGSTDADDAVVRETSLFVSGSSTILEVFFGDDPRRAPLRLREDTEGVGDSWVSSSFGSNLGVSAKTNVFSISRVPSSSLGRDFLLLPCRREALPVVNSEGSDRFVSRSRATELVELTVTDRDFAFDFGVSMKGSGVDESHASTRLTKTLGEASAGIGEDSFASSSGGGCFCSLRWDCFTSVGSNSTGGITGDCSDIEDRLRRVLRRPMGDLDGSRTGCSSSFSLRSDLSSSTLSDRSSDFLLLRLLLRRRLLLPLLWYTSPPASSELCDLRRGFSWLCRLCFRIV